MMSDISKVRSFFPRKKKDALICNLYCASNVHKCQKRYNVQLIDSCRSIMRHATFIRVSIYIRNQLTASFCRQGMGHRRIGRNNSKVNWDYQSSANSNRPWQRPSYGRSETVRISYTSHVKRRRGRFELVIPVLLDYMSWPPDTSQPMEKDDKWFSLNICKYLQDQC